MRFARSGLLAGALLLAACGGDSAHPNVVIVAIDTLRADHLGCYGYPRPTSPRIDAFAAESVLFEQTVAQSPWTLPSFASIMTGVIPERHGAGQGKLCLVLPCAALESQQETLAEVMRRAGYRTASFVSNGFVSAGVGLDRGFETAELSPLGGVAMRLARKWVETHQQEPMFLFVHLVEPHMPYEPPAADAAPFIDATYAGPIGARADFTNAYGKLDDADRRRIVDLYDGEVHADDRLVGTMLDTLEQLGLDRKTLVVLVADHGEELFDHGFVGHGHTLFDELLRVPLVVRFPAGEPRGRVAHQVRAMDVFPTVLEVAGIPAPPGLDAVSLVGAAHGDAPPPATANAIAEFTYRGPDLRALRTAEEKLVFDHDAGTSRLFDLIADPKETIDVGERRSEHVSTLRTVLDATETQSDPGIYVLARGGRRGQRFEVMLMEPKGGFSSIHPLALEDGDVVTMVPGGRIVRIAFRVGPDDLDGVRLQVADGDAPVTIVGLAADGVPLPAQDLFVGSRQAKHVPSVIAPREATVPRALPPPNRLQETVVVAIQAVVQTAPRSLRIDPDLTERLRALGYAP